MRTMHNRRGQCAKRADTGSAPTENGAGGSKNLRNHYVQAVIFSAHCPLSTAHFPLKHLTFVLGNGAINGFLEFLGQPHDVHVEKSADNG